MNQINSLINLSLNCDDSVDLIVNIFLKDDLRVSRSFDLQSACSAFSDNICRSHGEESCDCQLVVLLVYDGDQIPVSVVLHGHNGMSQIGIADDLGPVAPSKLQKRIENLLSLSNVRARQKKLVLNAK